MAFSAGNPAHGAEEPEEPIETPDVTETSEVPIDFPQSPPEVRQSLEELKGLTLEELLEVKIMRTSETLSEIPAVVRVVTGEHIRRSGVTSLPEALRLAGNLQVAQVSSRDWAVSARGFNNELSNKLLVMIDGRTVYTPLYAGVFWDVQNPLLEDIDRIEVVSGPGGTLWGANAVNGVINVVTKSAKHTQGLYLSGGAGTMLQDEFGVRYGGHAGPDFFYRAYVHHFDRNSTDFLSGLDSKDAWAMTQGGFRTDWHPSEENTLTFQGDFYAGNTKTDGQDGTADGQNLLTRWTHVIGPESDLQVQFYFDRTFRFIPNLITDKLQTFDLDAQHRFALGNRNEIVWGAGYRFMQDRVKNTPYASFLPPDRDLDLVSAFVQDEITLVPETLRLSVGTKVEHNDFSGFEVQPSARLAWTIRSNHMVWAAVSRAVRSPSRIDTDTRLPSPPVPPNTPFLTGSTDFDSERLIAYEIGYRVRPIEDLTVSAAFFYNDYEDLRSVDMDMVDPLHFVVGNHFEGATWGIELAANYQPVEWWQFRMAYNHLHKDLETTGGAVVLASFREGKDPNNQISFQSMLDLPAGFELDFTGRFVDALTEEVPAYFAADVRLAWRHRNVEIAVVGQNLTDGEHPEFDTREIPRSVYGKVTWRY